MAYPCVADAMGSYWRPCVLCSFIRPPLRREEYKYFSGIAKPHLNRPVILRHRIRSRSCHLRKLCLDTRQMDNEHRKY